MDETQKTGPQKIENPRQTAIFSAIKGIFVDYYQIPLESGATRLAKAILGEKNLEEADTEHMRERFPNASAKQIECFLTRIQQMRDIVMKRGKKQIDDTFQGDAFELAENQGQLTILAVDTPDTIDKIFRQDEFDLLLGLSTHVIGENNVSFDLYINETFAIEIKLTPEKEGDEPLHYVVEKPIPISQIKPYEIDLITSYLDQIPPPLP